MLTPLLATKLYIPRIRPNPSTGSGQALVPRPRLIARLNEGMACPFTLVSSPAGFGKTTLLSEWIPQSQRRVVWVSLDEGDNDPTRFWAYFIAALQGLKTSPGEKAKAFLQSPPPFALESFQNTLLNEIRADDLRFTPEESAMFLNQLMNLNLSAAEVEVFEARTEGWIAGLQMAALSVQGRDDISGFIKTFSGSHHFILDYLTEEVFQRQSESVQSFLLQTSILKRLSGLLCDAVVGQAGSLPHNSQTMLEQLERMNLFITPLDDERRWYRYHHLFGDLLRHRLQQTQPERLPELHRRAAAWFSQSNRTDEAIHHACAARDWQLAVQLIEQAITAAWSRGEIRTLSTWLEMLPDEHLRSRPRLSFYYSRALLLGGKMEAAEQRLRETEQALRASLNENPGVEGKLCWERFVLSARRWRQ